jgi:hypothetical protein
MVQGFKEKDEGGRIKDEAKINLCELRTFAVKG